MQDIGNIIAQLTAARSSLSQPQATQSQGGTAAANGSGNGNPPQSFQTALNTASQSTQSGQSTQPAQSSQSGQVLPPAQNNPQNATNSTAGQSPQSVIQSAIAANPSFAGLANLLGNIVGQKNPQAQPGNTAAQSAVDNLLINGTASGQGNQGNITSPEALLQFILGRNAALLAGNNNAPTNSGSANANISNAAPPVAASQPEKSQPSNNIDPASLASILAQINPVQNFAANSQGAVNASAKAVHSINPDAASGGLAKTLAQVSTITGQKDQPAPADNTNNNANNIQPGAANLQALNANQKTAVQNFALALANNAASAQPAKPTAKLVSENKIPDFSGFSNQVFTVKTDAKTAVTANSAINNVANEQTNTNIANAVAALDKTDGDQLKSDALKKDDANAMDAADASLQSQSKTDAGAVKAPANPVPNNNTVKYQTPAEQVVFQIAAAAKDGNSKINIKLQPAELGEINVSMHMSDGKLSLNITADRSSTLNMLQSDSKSLEKSLNDIGFKSDATNLSFNLRQGAGGGQQQNWGFAPSNYGPAANQDVAEVTAYSALPSMLTSNQALDIRV